MVASGVAASKEVITLSSSSPSPSASSISEGAVEVEEEEAKKTKMNVIKKRTKTSLAKKKKQALSSSSSSSSTIKSTASLSFPMSRVRRLVSNNTARTTVDAVFLVNRASELFLEQFAKDAYNSALQEQQKSISYNHLASTVYNEKRYEFLSDFVPKKLSAEDALKSKSLLET